MSRTVRYSDAFPPKKDDQGRHLCRRCDKLLTGRATSFCSKACRDEALIRCWPSEARRQLKARDHEVCARCGLDCKAAKAVIRAAERECWATGIGWDSRPARLSGHAAVWLFLGMKRGNRTTLWEANHIVPVVEGGGACGLDNFETLCLWCHRDHTAELRARMARARRDSSPQLELNTGD